MRITAYNNSVHDASVASNRWELYRVLSEPIRLRLLALAAQEELAIGELAELLGESQPNVSRHATLLKQAGLLTVRKQGTRALVRLGEDVAHDSVVSDALASGRALCAVEGSLARIADVIRAREAMAREFFAKPSDDAVGRTVPEMGAYLWALSPLLSSRSFAIDAGTGDGGLLDVLAPTFERVVAIDRSMAQLARAKERVALRGYTNVQFVEGELDGSEVRSAVAEGADVVFAVRLLHHAAQPAVVVAQLAGLCRPGGALVLVDYAHHDDETMRNQADLWLGFEPGELRRFAGDAGLEAASVSEVPSALSCPPGSKAADAHLPWQVLVAKKRATAKGVATISSIKKRKAKGHG